MALPIPPITDPDGHLDPEAVQFALDQIAKNFPLRVGTDNFVRTPQARVYNNAALTITTATLTALTFNSERWDYGTTTEQHSTAANASRLTCQVPGLHKMDGHVEFDANATGIRQAGIRLNGNDTLLLGRDLRASAGAALPTRISISTQYRLVVGDYVELVVYQNSGGNLNVAVAGIDSPELAWHWVSP